MGSGWTEFEEFVALCGPRLLRSAWLLTGDRHLAEDLLQTALARAWPKWRRIADEQGAAGGHLRLRGRRRLQPGARHLPLDPTRPRGDLLGGGIWLHVDHGGPTHACVTLSKAHMAELIRRLDPAAHPVVVMGDRAFLAR